MIANNRLQNPRNSLEGVRWVTGRVNLHFVSVMVNQHTKSRDDLGEVCGVQDLEERA